MTSFIIAGKNNDENGRVARKLCQDKAIDQFDITIITSEKESLGIEVVKKLQEKVFLMPLRSKEKAIIIPQAELLTIPAQNALLKLLEEPPAHTLLFLLTDNLEALLATIKSRCQIIKIEDPRPSLSDEEQELIAKQLEDWTTQDIGSALKKAEQLAKDKEKTLKTLEQLLIVGRHVLYQQVNTTKDVLVLSKQLRLLQQTHQTLNATNTSPRMTLEHLFLSFRI